MDPRRRRGIAGGELRDRGDGEAIGGIGLRLGTDVFRRSAEIGYWLGEPFWGRGIATEAAAARSRQYAFEYFDLCRLEAGVFEWNPASMRVLEKAGYSREGRARLGVTKDGRTGDRVLYGLVRPDRARAARRHRLPRGAGAPHPRRAAGARAPAHPVRAPLGRSAAERRGRQGRGRRFRRLGKRIVFALEDDLFLVIHLMIAGRLHWRAAGAKPPGKIGLAAFDFPTGTLILTEAGTKRRASLHVVRGEDALAPHDPGGLDVLRGTARRVRAALRRARTTRSSASLTDPRLFSGIGNAYSDEILHRARLSPVKLSQAARRGGDPPPVRGHARRAARVDRAPARRRPASEFPEGVTAFRPEMAVHGRYGKPCPVCGTPVQRIVYADNETNYCARCQTGGTPARRPLALAPAPRRLAEDGRRVGGATPAGRLRSYFPVREAYCFCRSPSWPAS